MLSIAALALTSALGQIADLSQSGTMVCGHAKASVQAQLGIRAGMNELYLLMVLSLFRILRPSASEQLRNAIYLFVTMLVLNAA